MDRRASRTACPARSRRRFDQREAVLDKGTSRTLAHAHTVISKLNLYYGPGGGDEGARTSWAVYFEKEELEVSSRSHRTRPAIRREMEG